MATNHLPVHPTKRHPLTGEPLQAIYVSPRTGRAFWPIIGAADDDAAAAQAAADAEAARVAAAAAAAGAGDQGFPANTPVEQMTAPQREAYYKHQAQKWQGRAENSYGLLNDLGVKTPEEVAAIKTKVEEHERLAREQMTEHERAVAEATDTAKAEVRGELIPELVRAKFEAAAAGRIEDATLATILAPLDLTKFLTTDGKVDTEKVKTYVDGVAPAKGNQRPGPTANGNGNRTGSDAQGSAQERAASRLERLGIKAPAQ